MYAGETLRITFTGEDWDGSPITPANSAGVTIAIFDSENVQRQAEVDMVWEVGPLEWAMYWNTDGAAPGTYEARITVTANSGGKSIGFKLIVLLAPPAGPYVVDPNFGVVP